MLVCEHAGQAIPERLKGLGITGADLVSHIGWGIGAGAVSHVQSIELFHPRQKIATELSGPFIAEINEMIPSIGRVLGLINRLSCFTMLIINFNQSREERRLDVSMLSSRLQEVANSKARIEPAVYTRLFLDLLMEEGFAPREVLVNTGLTAGYLAEPGNLISLEQQIQIYSNIARLTESPRITLNHGTKIKPHHHGAWGYAVQSAQTIGQALKTFNKFWGCPR